MLNTFALVGVVNGNPAPIGQGTYYKIRLDVENTKANRTDPIEVIAKADAVSQIRDKNIVAAQGSIGGKITDKGYLNVSLFAMNLSVLSSSGKNEMPWSDDDVPY